jgi:hypothetical protein
VISLLSTDVVTVTLPVRSAWASLADVVIDRVEPFFAVVIQESLAVAVQSEELVTSTSIVSPFEEV